MVRVIRVNGFVPSKYLDTSYHWDELLHLPQRKRKKQTEQPSSQPPSHATQRKAVTVGTQTKSVTL